SNWSTSKRSIGAIKVSVRHTCKNRHNLGQNAHLMRFQALPGRISFLICPAVKGCAATLTSKSPPQREALERDNDEVLRS
ncbi:MAG: hypothetical protein ACXV5N_13615, partial [Halobacteriota archaeon]